MNLRIIATTNTKDFANKDDFNKFSGKMAGICYNEEGFEKLENEPAKRTERRIQMTKGNGHHSVYEHEYVTMYLENIPKLFAILLNNEKTYVTSEKSGRYTKMQGEGLETELYDKWQKIFVEEITKKYGDVPYFSESRIDKLAKENARLFLSIYSPATSMAYTTSYRQLNYIYGWMKNINEKSPKLLQKLKPYAEEFCQKLEENNLIDCDLQKDGKGRNFSLFTDKNREEYFGDVYCTTYEGSWVHFAQAQRHRTINYEVKPLGTPRFYVPKIIENNKALKEEWIADMNKVKDNHPQGELVHIIERGTPENFVLKTYERFCTCAQLEIMDQTSKTLDKYIKYTKCDDIKEYLQQYNKGARCTFKDFKCTQPCGFKEGINLSREI